VVRAVAQIGEEFDTHGELVARPIPLSDLARRRLIYFKVEIGPHLGPGGDLQAMADWGNKLPGLVARLAGILHVGDHAADAVNGPLRTRRWAVLWPSAGTPLSTPVRPSA
jgi:hypothetical protein